MSLAVCLLFDRYGERVLRQLWARLEARGIPTLAGHTHGRHQPHLSYAVLLDGDPEAVLTILSRLPDGGPFATGVHGVVTFPRGRACLAVAATAEVVRRQEAVVAALQQGGCTLHKHYLPGEWVPHCSLSPRASGALLPQVVTAVTDILPLTLTVDHAALIDTGTGRTWPLPHIP